MRWGRQLNKSKPASRVDRQGWKKLEPTSLEKAVVDALAGIDPPGDASVLVVDVHASAGMARLHRIDQKPMRQKRSGLR